MLPSSGPGGFVNNLDVALELYDPSGTMVASDSSGALSHAAISTGSYAVRVLAEGGTSGEYVLHVGGYTGTLPPLPLIANSFTTESIQTTNSTLLITPAQNHDVALLGLLEDSDDDPLSDRWLSQSHQIEQFKADFDGHFDSASEWIENQPDSWHRTQFDHRDWLFAQLEE